MAVFWAYLKVLLSLAPNVFPVSGNLNILPFKKRIAEITILSLGKNQFYLVTTIIM